MEFEINHTWDGLPVNHDPVTIVFKPADEGLAMVVTAPFFIDPPPPPGKPGKPFPGLWDYEVVEAFFLCHESKHYLEVELCPHGQHLTLLLSGRRNVWKQELPLTFDVTRKDTSWEGSALIPWSYFPYSVDRFNAYAIHGSGDYRTYEALYSIPQSKIEVGQQPDFHRLEYFEPFSFDAIMGEAWKQPVSDLWMTQLPDKCQ